MDKIIKMRQNNAQYMNNGLGKISNIEVPSQFEDSVHVYQLYTIRVKDGEDTRNALKEYLINNGISCKIYFDPVHLTSFYRNKYNYNVGDLPITERVAKEVLTLPMYPHLAKDEMDYMIEKINIFFKDKVE
jgi:perosamine synthetase